MRSATFGDRSTQAASKGSRPARVVVKKRFQMSRSPVQLELPIHGMHPPFEPTPITRTRRVFVNRNLKMGGIDWVGFDMDYTLAIYNQAEMDRLSVEATIKKL